MLESMYYDKPSHEITNNFFYFSKIFIHFGSTYNFAGTEKFIMHIFDSVGKWMNGLLQSTRLISSTGDVLMFDELITAVAFPHLIRAGHKLLDKS